MTVSTQLEAMSVHVQTPNYHSPRINILVKVNSRTQLAYKKNCLHLETHVTLIITFLKTFSYVMPQELLTVKINKHN